MLFRSVSMGFGHRNCVVIGCPTIRQRLGKWAATTCELYGCNNGLGMCDCEPLFKLFPFPTKKNPERRLQWAKNISRNSLNRLLWMPNKIVSSAEQRKKVCMQTVCSVEQKTKTPITKEKSYLFINSIRSKK